MQLEDYTTDEDSGDDVDWQPAEDDEESIDDHQMYDSDDSRASDEEGGFMDYPMRPKKYPSPTFESMFPRLTESESYFKLSAWDARCLAGEVMQDLHRCDLPFCQSTEEILKDALLRYLVVACRP